MPASNMGSTSGAGNPSTGKFVVCDLISGPKGSPLDKDTAGNFSTGALSTGIGYGASRVIGPVAPQSIKDAGFTDDYIPGVSKPDGSGSLNSTYMYIGGGRSNAMSNGIAVTNPYTAGFGIGGFGAGGSRDGGAGPAFTGFKMKMVTGAAAIGADIEAGFANRSGVAMLAGQSAFGSSDAAAAAIS
jgi:hypothetical protein